MSPKVVIYVRAYDARVIEALTDQDISTWVREGVRNMISDWHDERIKQTVERPMPVAWANHAEAIEERKDDDAS